MKQKKKKVEKKTSWGSIALAVGIVAILIITTFIVLFAGSPSNNETKYSAEVSYKTVKDENDEVRTNWTILFTRMPSDGLGAWNELEWAIKRANGKKSEMQPFMLITTSKWELRDTGPGGMPDSKLGNEDKITIRSDYFNADLLIAHGDIFIIYEKEGESKIMEIKLE